MFPSFTLLRKRLREIIAEKEAQGHVVEGLMRELDALPDRYDSLSDFALTLSDLPHRDDWPYVEPNELEEIWEQCDPTRPLGLMAPFDGERAAARVQTAFLGAVCGCVLGKPVEMSFDLYQIRNALENLDEWPLQDYFPEKVVEELQIPYPSLWGESVRERISYVPWDDDLNYKIINMLLLESHGTHFAKDDIRALWLKHLPIESIFGPERTLLMKAALPTLEFGEETDFHQWVSILNPKEEWCGALIRADTFGYACPGRPALAAELAWRDASWTHRRTGIYGSMFIAATIATAPVADHPMDIFTTAAKFIPQRSRFRECIQFCIDKVGTASDWLEGYGRVHERYGEYGFCRIFQEIGTLINTTTFAKDISDGICMQVCQGNDTDSFGATAGSILGAFLGPDCFDSRWVEPFHDEIRTTIAGFYERSLQKVAQRIGNLPNQIHQELQMEMHNSGEKKQEW